MTKGSKLHKMNQNVQSIERNSLTDRNQALQSYQILPTR